MRYLKVMSYDVRRETLYQVVLEYAITDEIVIFDKSKLHVIMRVFKFGLYEWSCHVIGFRIVSKYF